MRKHFTTWHWYQDRLCCLSCTWLLSLTVLLIGFLLVVVTGTRQFLDDLAFLFGENDLRDVALVGGLLVVTSAGLWLLACCLWSLGRRLVLHLRGL